MKKVFNRDYSATIEVNSRELADLWYCVEATMDRMKADGLEESMTYIRLKDLEADFK